MWSRDTENLKQNLTVRTSILCFLFSPLCVTCTCIVLLLIQGQVKKLGVDNLFYGFCFLFNFQFSQNLWIFHSPVLLVLPIIWKSILKRYCLCECKGEVAVTDILYCPWTVPTKRRLLVSITGVFWCFHPNIPVVPQFRYGDKELPASKRSIGCYFSQSGYALESMTSFYFNSPNDYTLFTVGENRMNSTGGLNEVQDAQNRHFFFDFWGTSAESWYVSLSSLSKTHLEHHKNYKIIGEFWTEATYVIFLSVEKCFKLSINILSICTRVNW